jgi:Flp pilus assembly protein TadB
MDIIREFLRSRKFLVALFGLIAALVAFYVLHLPEAAGAILLASMTYVIGQGKADQGKEAAKILSQSGSAITTISDLVSAGAAVVNAAKKK